MRLICRHGHFAFYPRDEEDISKFASYYDLEVVRVQDFYTFADLVDAKDYSLAGLAYLNLTATKTYEGNPWDIFRENNFVYDLVEEELALKTSVKTIVDLPATDNYFISPVPLIQPGSFDKAGNRILSYDAEFIQDTFQLKVREFSYV